MQGPTELLEDYQDRFFVCADFSKAYWEEQDNVTLKLGLVEGQDLHVYVYDEERDVTMDATAEQFSAYNPEIYQNDWFIGDEHPHLEELAEAETPEELDAAVEEHK